LGLFSHLFGARKTGPKKVRTNIAKRFSVHGPLGTGSMSKVLRATDRKLGREVCLKILDKKSHRALVARFPGLKRPEEGEVAVSLKHPNVVETYDWGWTLHDEPFLVMELIRGVGLNYFADAEGRRPLNRRLDYLIQAADGLAYFHERGFIHRDVSPKNVMVDDNGRAKLIDFGLCVPNTPEFRRPGNRTGTVRYMAPELIKRSPTDQRIDVFSFGVATYEVLAGGLPWEFSESMQEMLAHVNQQGRDPRELNPNLDEETAGVILKGIERNPADRYQTMREFAEALRSLESKKAPEAPASRPGVPTSPIRTRLIESRGAVRGTGKRPGKTASGDP
jgi:serine/threonine protein kinase